MTEAGARPSGPSASGTGRGGLRPGLSSFVGRTGELVEVAELLERSRLLTLTGAPGIGKTRLALQVAEGHRGGAALAELAPVSDAALLPATLASALKLQETPGEGLTDTLLAHLHGRSLLLVLDNCEHLVGACAPLVEMLLGGCPGLKVLATSREPLGLAGERVWQVPPLSLPDAGDAATEGILGYESVSLFLERASEVKTSFELSEEVAPAVAEICRRLDGIPLAIELSAARIEILTPAEIVRRLDQRFALLTSAHQTAPPRHQTLAAALDWSHELLSGSEQALLRRLSIFVGPFGLEAAEEVCAGDEIEPSELLDLLGQLVSKSLVVSNTANSRGRYRLLETIRAYGTERLRESGEQSVAAEAHARFYLALSEQAEPELVGPSQVGWFERLEEERPNLRSALEFSLAEGRGEWALRLAGALIIFWRVRCHFSEGRDLLERALAAGESEAPALRAKALWGVGFMDVMTARPAEGVAALEQSASLFRELGDRKGRARALMILANCQQSVDRSRVLPLLEESVALAREVCDSWCLAHALGVAGIEYSVRCEPATARPLLEECLAVAREAEDKQGLRIGLLSLGQVTLTQGDYPLTESLLDEAVAVSRELGEDYASAVALTFLGQLAFGRGDYGRAQALVEESFALLPEVSPSNAVVNSLVLLARVAQARGDRDGARRLFERALARAPNCQALRGLGELDLEEGSPEDARLHFEEALRLARASGRAREMAEALHCSGRLARASGEARRAAALHHEALEFECQIDEPPRIVTSLEAVAGLTAAAGRHQQATRLFGAASALRERGGYARPPWESSGYEADVALVREGLSAEELETAWAEGERLSLEDAVAQASKGRGRRVRTKSGWPSLTERERQVADLVAESLTNPEIAERMLITLDTVKTHVSHIFAKLGIADRRELAREVKSRKRS